MRSFRLQSLNRARSFNQHVLLFSSKGKGGGKTVESKYSSTVFLPQTSFEQRSNSIQKEPAMQRWWEENRIYEKLNRNNPGDLFVLHDGPPYANGDLHIGHAMNKILKDFINKYQMLKGKKVAYVPGWDCHGLPIELKVLQGMKASEREKLTPITLRQKAAEFANATVETQKQCFKRYGVWGDWEQPYLTLQPEYEAAQIKVFGQMVARGHIYRGKKPVHWSPSSRTALAEAELEYPDNHVSRSIYVGFQATKFSPALQKIIPNASTVRVAIWTTTPWTIPANLGVAVNASLDYCLLSNPQLGKKSVFLVARDLAEQFAANIGYQESMGELVISEVVKGKDLVGTQYQHPLYPRVSEIILGGDYITTESGTGLVHTAPGHGQEDYLTGLKHNLPLLSPVDDAGCFTMEAGADLQGLSVLGEGNTAVIKKLAESGSLLREEAYNHKYPYDWRTKKPTIFRATEQWFASVSTFRQEALQAIDGVTWIPSIGRNRIASMTESRGDWCISRQRSWGVPIPVFYEKQTREPLMTNETLGHIEGVIAEKGSDAWWELPVSELLPPTLRHLADNYEKGADTMDVWFDSGTSWAGVLQARPSLAFPADVYLEGSDQSRGWFQSSLLTSVASQGVAPYKAVLTHGFVLDEKGSKMSKSLGNVVDPKTIIEGGANQIEMPPYGADTLRMWVSGVDFSGDVCVGKNIMKQVFEQYRKVRNTLRYLLGSLSDFNPTTDSVAYDQLPAVDKYMLGVLSTVVSEVESAYDNYQFYKANQAVLKFVTNELSSFYVEVAKDRLYISKRNEFRRRSCQTVLQVILEQLALLVAPIAPHLAEEVWQNLPYPKATQSVFEKGWVSLDQRFAPHDPERWQTIIALRNDVNKCIETARQAKRVGASMEAAVCLHTDKQELRNLLESLQGDDRLLSRAVKSNAVDDLRFLTMTSQVKICQSVAELQLACPDFQLSPNESETGALVGVTNVTGKKCERCWYYCESVGEDKVVDDLCQRCAHVIGDKNL
ncbi:isoleucine--tRNA ligase [archaeon]|nr:MAG: isoleucine--tRNA ligase [archaeon]